MKTIYFVALVANTMFLLSFELPSFNSIKSDQKFCDVLNIIANDSELFVTNSSDGFRLEDSLGDITEVLTTVRSTQIQNIIIYDTFNFFLCRQSINSKSKISIVSQLPNGLRFDSRSQTRGVYFLAAIRQEGDVLGVSLKDLSNLTYIIYSFKIEKSGLKLVDKTLAVF